MSPLPEPRTVVILGVPFHDVTMAETLGQIDALVAARRPRYIATANLDFAALASHDVELQRILLEAHLVLCDGTPLIWASRWLGAPLRVRVAGSDLIPLLAGHAAARGHRLFFLGADDATLAEVKARLTAAHPGLIVAGMYSPPIAKLLDLDNTAILERIQAACPDILLVGFGCPKQEKWIYMNLPRLNVPVSIGVGGTFDMIAGRVRRAPVWMRRCGLEWTVRLAQEPRRLFNRYLFDLLFFVRALRHQRALLKQAAAPVVSAAPVEEAPLLRDYRLVTWTGRADADAVQAHQLAAPIPADGINTVFLDCSTVTFMDSTGLGWLLRGYRTCKQVGGDFALINPCPAVASLLKAMGLDRLILSHGSITQARTAAGLLRRGSAGEAAPGDCVLRLEGDVIASRISGLARWLDDQWDTKRDATRLVLDLGAVKFIDSSGLGLLLRARKLALDRPGGTLVLRGAPSNVRNVIMLARLAATLGLEPAP
jgi:exopolysaccharide biosynthesis WecB/TagA/CpsF family protein/anti-anti-sigma factor